MSSDRTAEKNLRLQRIIVEGMNARDWDIFDKHHAEDVVVRWPGGQPPTIGRGSPSKGE